MKQMLLKLNATFILLILLVIAGGAWGQTISPGSASVAACPSFPTPSATVTNITLTEAANNDIVCLPTLVIAAPSGFQFSNAGTVTDNNGDVASATSALTNSTTITITFVCDGGNTTNSFDQLILTGIQIIGVGPSAGTGNITVSSETGFTFNAGAVLASLTSTVGSPGTISLSSGAGTNNQTLCQNTAGPSPLITFAVGGGATGATVSGLPAGMSGSFGAGTYTISGTPTAAPGSYPYTVTTTGMAPCAAVTATGTITVIAPISALSYATPVTYCSGIAIANNTPTITGGGTFTYSVSPSLPTGLTLNTTTGVISGTPTTATAAANYTVTASNGCSTRNATVNITVTQGPTISTNGGDQTLALCATTATLTGNTPTFGTGNWTVAPLGPSITTPGSPTSGVTGLVPGTPYTFTWTITNAPCGSSTSSMTVTSPIGPGCVTYCTPTPLPGSTTTGQITNVTFNTINNTNAGANVGYENFTAFSTPVNEGQSYNISITATSDVDPAFPVGTANDPSCLTVYFDFNSDGDFTDAGEATSITASFTGTQTFGPIPLTIACGALPGVNLRMRVVLHDTDCTNPCILTGEGQIEDYTIVVTAATVPVANAGSPQIITCTSNATLNSTASTPAPANGYWSLVSGAGDLTNSTSPTSGVTGLSNGDNIFQWTEVGVCANSTALVTINVSGLPDVPVSAGDDIYTCTQGLTLSGSDPSPFTGQWVVGSGPNTPTFTPSINDPNAQVSGMINGTYVLHWQVNAGGCGIISDQMTFNFGSLPAPNAGTNITTCPTGTVLNGNDFSGAIGTWTVFSGPGGSGFLDDNDPNTTIYGLVPGSYVLHWTVSGGGCAGGTFDDVTITVNACTTAVSHSSSGSQSFSGCSYTYTDNGGSGGNYSNGIAQTWTTFCPDDPNDFATLTFSAANFSNGDYITIYDDNGPAAPIIASYWFDPSPGGGMVLNPPLGTTITSSTGCLYIQMNSTAATNTSGFVAAVGCSSTAGVQNTDFITVNNCGGGGGITLCGTGTIPAIAGSETNPPDLGGANSGCLGSQEGASNTWVYMTAETDGYIAFEISPAGGQDFDYAIWGPYDGGFACPGNTLDDPLRCSWASNGGAGCPAEIGLGILDATGGSVLPGDVSENGACNATNEGWTYPILANAGDVYVLLFQNYSYNNSSFDVTINSDPTSIPPGGTYATLGCTPPEPLPIELISFVGEHKDRVNKLYWNCASESHNDYFTIERSSDGQNWTVLAIVDGAGFSQSLTHYSTIDPSPLTGTNYYRLSQTDFDGRKRKYKTIAISTEIKIENMFSDVYPNPTDNSFYFNYGGKDFESAIQLNMFNTAGQLMLTETFDTFNATQSLEIETTELPAGIYYVSISQNDKREMKKISIIK